MPGTLVAGGATRSNHLNDACCHSWKPLNASHSLACGKPQLVGQRMTSGAQRDSTRRSQQNLWRPRHARACECACACGETGKWECGLLRGADIQEEGHLGLWESDLLEPPLERVGVMRKDELWPNNPS